MTRTTFSRGSESGKQPFLSVSNMGSLLMALALAIMVWMAATIQENPFAEGTLPELVPVEVANRGEGLVIVGGLVQEVGIRVRAPESVWEDLGSSGFRAYVDLEGLEVGLHEVPVRVEPASSLVRILETSPAALTVRLDTRAEKVVRVRVSVYGNPPLGYGAGTVLVEPSQMRVSGPQTLVDQVAQLTVEVYLSGEKDTFERSAPLTPRDEVGNTVDGLELEQKSARVTVPIQQQVGYRELSIKTIIEGNPAPGYWISSITADPSTVTVFGDPGAVNDIPGYLETYPVNVAGEAESVSQRVAIVLPEGVSSLEDMGTVQALIEISPVLSGQTVQLTPVLMGLGRGLEATYSPDTVEVILAGPLSELEALEAGDVRVILDLSDFEPGTHFVSLVVERPGSLQVQAVLPDQVEVVIGES
jgi:YbbR domain-containing protein